jgi:hypothetical protein
MKIMHRYLHVVSCIVGCIFVTACTTVPVAPTSIQQLIANAVEDTISVGLVPVLTKNSSYVPAAQSIALALGTFSGTELTPENVHDFLARTPLTGDDARTVEALVNAAWQTFTRRYQAQVGASLRPDVKLFLGAVSSGISNAIAALPRTTDLKSPPPAVRDRPLFGACGVPAIGRA